MFATRKNEWWHWDFKGPFKTLSDGRKCFYFAVVVDKCSKKTWTKAFQTKDNEPFVAWLQSLILENSPPEKVTFDHGTDTGSAAIKGKVTSKKLPTYLQK